MTAAILPFPRAPRVAERIDRTAVLRRARFAARHAGLLEHSLYLVDNYANQLLDQGKPADAVVQASRSYATQLLDSLERA